MQTLIPTNINEFTACENCQVSEQNYTGTITYIYWYALADLLHQVTRFYTTPRGFFTDVDTKLIKIMQQWQIAFLPVINM